MFSSAQFSIHNIHMLINKVSFPLNEIRSIDVTKFSPNYRSILEVQEADFMLYFMSQDGNTCVFYISIC